MISDYIDRYLEVYDPGRSYEIIESFVINNHEIAWMKIDNLLDPKNPYSYHELMCECEFAEGIGWKIGENGTRYSIHGSDRCRYKYAICYMRQRELRDYYDETLPDAKFWGSILGDDQIATVVRDLINRVKLGEFIGATTAGARTWGGYFYLQTVAEITDKYLGHLWGPIHKMWADKEISLEGAVVRDYDKPVPPLWVEKVRIKKDKWVGTASIPGHADMALEWRYEVFRPDGSPAYSLIPGDPLTHSPEIKVHPQDLANAKKRLRELICQARRSREDKTD